MIFLQSPPHPQLQDYIAQYLYVALENRREMGNMEQTFFPIDIPCIAFYSRKLGIGSNGTLQEASSIFTGLNRSAISLRFLETERTWGLFVSLKPHGFTELFRRDNIETDDPVDFYSVLGLEAETLHEELKLAGDFSKQVTIADAFFLKKKPLYDFNAPVRMACWQIIRKNGLVNIKTLADEANLSLSSMERNFTKTVGIPPKQFARIKRFHYALKLMHTARSNLTDIAHTCGYYDQAHFIRDFQSFTRQTPSSFKPEAYTFFYQFIIYRNYYQ